MIHKSKHTLGFINYNRSKVFNFVKNVWLQYLKIHQEQPAKMETFFQLLIFVGEQDPVSSKLESSKRNVKVKLKLNQGVLKIEEI